MGGYGAIPPFGINPRARAHLQQVSHQVVILVELVLLPQLRAGAPLQRFTADRVLIGGGEFNLPARLLCGDKFICVLRTTKRAVKTQMGGSVEANPIVDGPASLGIIEDQSQLHPPLIEK